ncbi:MAG: sugar phosphate isomerase/epimerase [Clostridia bacterium]|nr:sugar phosphate isomerase/epimerase [Clostridia bacterium]
MDRRIGAQYYTLRDYLKTIEDFDESCKKVKEIGYQIIQISGTPLPARDMKEVIDKYGLEVVTTHREFDDFANNLDFVIEYNKTLGSKLCGLGGMPKAARADKESMEQFIQQVNRATEEIKKEGLFFGYHNHAFEFAKHDGKTMMEHIIEETDPENFKFIVDTYWVQVGGKNPAEFIRKLGPRAMAVHFKDMKATIQNASAMAEIGYGNFDWDNIISACDEAGTKWAIVEQDFCDGDPFDCLKTSYEFLKTKGFH